MIGELLLLEALDRLERRVLGGKPVYDPARLGQRLFDSPRAGRALRLVYAPALAAAKRRLKAPALLFGPLVALAELLAMPLTGATPPLRKWRPREIALLFAHATAFALLV
ncbi:MAG: hypothetical protein ABR567_05305 [Myxococcales bacterium]|nr:hypothetical protein [Myxococcales bacterium]